MTAGIVSVFQGCREGVSSLPTDLLCRLFGFQPLHPQIKRSGELIPISVKQNYLEVITISFFLLLVINNTMAEIIANTPQP